MVYNVGGGNKSKGLARKFVVQNQSNGNSKTVRTVKEAGEQYAIVQKHLGNCMCMVMCSDGYKRLCIIRKKFTGRRKTDNNISSGSVVLVGLHDYSTSSEPSKSAGELKRCDLLYVYSEQEKEKLRKVCDLSKLSSSLDDSTKPSSGAGSGGSGLFPDTAGDDIQFITSGTGIFNKYAKEESRRKGVVEFGNSGGNVRTNVNVISGSDWITDLPPIDSDDDGADDGDINDEESIEEIEEDTSDEDDEASVNNDPEPECQYQPINKNKNTKDTIPKQRNVIEIDDI
jgi:initiation factor 1A